MTLEKDMEQILCKGSDNQAKLCDFDYLGQVTCPYRLEGSGQCRYKSKMPYANVEIRFRKPMFYDT